MLLKFSNLKQNTKFNSNKSYFIYKVQAKHIRRWMSTCVMYVKCSVLFELKKFKVTVACLNCRPTDCLIFKCCMKTNWLPMIVYLYCPFSHWEGLAAFSTSCSHLQAKVVPFGVPETTTNKYINLIKNLFVKNHDLFIR